MLTNTADETNPKFERFADPLDEATAKTAAMTEGAVAAARLANAPETHEDFDGEHCVDCDVSIPPARLALGKVRCVNCQQAIETRRKQHGRPGAAAAWGNTDA